MEPVTPFGGARNHTTGDCRLEIPPSGHAAKVVRDKVARNSSAATDDAGAIRRDTQYICGLPELDRARNQRTVIRYDGTDCETPSAACLRSVQVR